MKRFRVAIDTTPLESGHRVRGMGSYVKQLAQALERDSRITVHPVELRHGAGRILITEYDLLHIPYFDLFFPTLKIPSEVPTVVTVPDVIPLLYPKHYPPGVRGRINFTRQKRELQKASAIITISETSKKDIIRFLGIPQEKIFVTHLAPGNEQSSVISHSPRFGEAGQSSVIGKLPRKFVLYIGDVNYNKNILRLAEACKKIKIPLVIVGKQAASKDYDRGHPENRELRELQDKYGEDKDVIRLGFLEEEDFATVWKKASVYCQPSLYEGFGLPVVEAFAAKVPVVCAKTQALAEVAGDAACYFDPYCVDDMAGKLKGVIENRKLQRDLRGKSAMRIKKFSWKKTARATIRVYEKIS